MKQFLDNFRLSYFIFRANNSFLYIKKLGRVNLFRVVNFSIFCSHCVVFIFLFTYSSFAQTTPPHYNHIPANSGTNNIFFHTSLTQKFQFIYTQNEIAGMTSPVTGPIFIDTIWFRHGGGSSTLFTVLSNFTIRLGHTTLTAPTPHFNSNFNVGTPQTVMSVANYTYTPLVGAWNVTSDNWTYIKLQTPFSYNFIDNLCVELSFSASSGLIIGNYANNGGVPITQYTGNFSDTVATSTTARPVFGISPGGCALPNLQLGPDLSLCNQTSYTISANQQNPGTTYSWSNGSNSNSLIVNTTGLYWVSATNSCGTVTDSIQVEFNSSPQVNAGNDIVVCAGQAIQLNGNVSGGNYLWTPSQALSSNSLLNPQVVGVPPPFYVLSSSQNGCTSTDTVLITVFPTPTVSAGADINASAGDTITLTGTGNGNFSWSPAQGFSCTTCPNPVMIALETSSYVLTVTDSNGCFKTDTVFLLVEGTCELKIPNVFTPNDDGLNEEIRFDNACIKKMELMIFNRWGVMVYESNVIPVIWQPENLNDGVYYYLIKAIYVNDKSVEKSGYIQLIK